MTGALFENYLVTEIVKKIKHTCADAELFYYRTSHGVEVDLIIDWKTHRDFIKIKSGETFHPRMITTIESLMAKQDKGYLLYRGKQHPYASNMHILNYQDYLVM